MKSFSDTVRARRAIRQFLSQPIEAAIIEEVLEEAQLAPSNCNTQPWNIQVVSGNTLGILSNKMLEAHKSGKESPDFVFDMEAYKDQYGERLKAQGKSYYESLGVKRDDKAERARAVEKNYRFFNAPHCVFLFMPKTANSVRMAGDLGHYGQTLMLSLAARGIGSIPLTSVGFYSDVVREVLGVSVEYQLLYGIAFGHADTEAISYPIRLGRDPIEKSVTFHS
jgi:nitroreductase